MADDKKKEDTEEKEEGGEDSEEEEEGQGGSPLKLALFIGVPLVVISSVVGALFFLGVFSGAEDAHAAEEAVVEEEEVAEVQVYETYGISDLLINLKGTGGRSHFLKLSIALELIPNESIPDLKKQMESVKPRIIDQFQMYLREMTVDDLQGSGGLQRLREELLQRVNDVSKPLKVNNILFIEMLIQ